MGEIKSTLDLVMEKTSGLTLSDEEKREVKRGEIEGKVKGLLQRYSDHVMSIEKLKKEIDALDKTEEDVRGILVRKCVALIKPETDNTSLIEALSYVAGMDPKPFNRVLEGYDEDLKHNKSLYETRLAEQLSRQGISGGAVIPNVSVDPEWVRFSKETKVAFQDQLHSLVEEVLSDK
ncbi:MAG: hypothetical protein V2J25_15500 [Desulfatiglans sp.]|jgi:hypothetical protein|nr:hypothetical protein [Thermodesulfobacteriota bacterium]MEE4354266.1 hypothetical protein [Desulfatiglans sp.]